MTVEIKVTPTRNPHYVTFGLDRDLLPPGTGLSFSSPETANEHPIASAIFQVSGVQSVWILGNEIQVCKDEKVRWGSIQAKILEAIKRSVNSSG